MCENSKELLRSDIVFCFWSYNDIDHMVPIIYRISNDDSRVKVTCVIFNLTEDYHTDYRVQFLSSLGIRIIHIADLCGINTALFSRSRGTKNSGVNIFSRVYSSLSYRLYWKKVQHKLELFYKDLLPELFFDKVFSQTSGILVTDHQLNKKYDSFINYAKTAGYLTVAVPHGPGIGTACSSRNWDPNDEISLTHRALPQLQTDYVLYANQSQADTGIAQGLSEKKQSLVLGSVRFSKEWILKQKNILPDIPLPVLSPKVLKIVLMATKPDGRLYKEELDRIISYIAAFPDTFLLIKSHTRGEQYDFSGKNNIRVVGNDIPSPNLIEWADVTFFTHSSIVLESIRRDKPVIFLKRATQDRMVHEQVMKEWAVICQEELCHFMWQLIINKTCRTYSKEERTNCLRSYVEPKGVDVLGYYSNFFLSQLKIIKEEI